jgi:hypothetical protein
MNWLARLLEWATREAVGRVDDELLGPLVLNDGGTEGCWVARVVAHGRPICFEIAGRYEPAPKLVNHARDIFLGFDTFVAEIEGFLEAEAARMEPCAAEIRALAIRDITLFWPDRPDDGMIFFDGGNDCRCWRCELVGRAPIGLTFDR